MGAGWVLGTASPGDARETPRLCVCCAQTLGERLRQAAASGSAEEVGALVRELTEAGVSVDAVVDSERGRNALHVAADNRNRGAAEALLAAGADVNARLQFSKPGPFWSARYQQTKGTALHLAVDHDAFDVAQLLLSAGADLRMEDEVGRAPLHLAARNGSVDMIEMLLASGMNVDMMAGDGTSALHHAAACGEVAAVRALLAAGANVNAQVGNDRHGGCTPLYFAVDCGRMEVVQVLLAAGADTQLCGYEWGPPLGVAARAGNVAMLRALLDAGADAGNGLDATPLVDAAGEGHGACVAALLAAGAAIDDNREGYSRTALMAAAERGHIGVLHLLLGAGANTDVECVVHGSRPPMTALAMAALGGHNACMTALLAAGASFRPGTLPNLEHALLPVWEVVPGRLQELAQHMEPAALARVRAALAALRLRTPLCQPEVYMSVVGLALQR